MREVTKIRLNSSGNLGAWLFILGPFVSGGTYYLLARALTSTSARFYPMGTFDMLPYWAGIGGGAAASLIGFVLLLTGREYYRD